MMIIIALTSQDAPCRPARDLVVDRQTSSRPPRAYIQGNTDTMTSNE